MTQNDVHKIFLIKKNFVILTQGHSLLILERGEGRERKEGQKHWLVASPAYPNQGLNPQPRRVLRDQELNPLLFGLWDDAPTNWATLVRARLFFIF